MSVVRPQTPSGHSLFCEDVRAEDNGKQILIGVYGSYMLVPGFPFFLPTFRIIIRYNERRGVSAEPIKFRVTVPGNEEPIFEGEIPRESIEAATPPSPDPELDDPI